jgi:glycosyltransferase involved in cell wall biosynthesis
MPVACDISTARQTIAGAEATRATLAVVVLTYNEAGRIRRCLESVAWCGEIVIVDGHSTDSTVAIARDFTDKIYLSDLLGPKNPGGFAAQRNFALDQVAAEWVFFLDADEQFTPELAAEVRQILAGEVPADVSAFQMRRREHFFGVFTPYTHGEGWLTRLMRRSAACWDGRLVHEGLRTEGRTASLQGHLLHFSKDSIADYLATQNRYTTLEAEQAVLEGRKLPRSPLFGMVRTFLNVYVYKGAYREGAFGLVMSLCFAHYTFLCWAKQWEIEMKAGRASSTEPRSRWLEWCAAVIRRLWLMVSPQR